MLGRTVGPYEIIGKLGEGGMGEVYRARDTRLNRDVALKILPEALAGDADRLARFRREAQVLAALNHPNVAHLYGFEEAPGTAPALVMELVEGPTLAEVVGPSAPGPQGPGLHLTQALQIAKQIAEALEAAHEQGIVHRDLKPANIKVREDGTVKVLDFGLAKALGPDDSPAKAGHYDLANSPTLTARATQMGMILGTAAYMAPEQAKGKPVDKRADIWAFGVVFYEMLTGKCPFIAETVPETLAHVITREIDTTTLPASTPPQIRKLIASCLVKDPKMRLRDIGDARLILGEPSTPSESSASLRPGPLPPPFMARFLRPTAGVLFVLAAAALVYSSVTRQPSDTTSIHLSIAMPQGEQLTTVPAISPDGKTIAYAAGRTIHTSRLYVRALDSFDARPVSASNGAIYPFFSPDGRSLAFFAGGKLLRVPAAGGEPQTLAQATRAWGGAWRQDGTIVYAPTLTAGLWSVPESGGAPTQLTKPDGAALGYGHVFPQRIGASSDLLFAFWGQNFYSALLSAKDRTWRSVITPMPLGGARAIATYSPNGYLIAGDGTAGMVAAPWTPTVTANVNPETPVVDSAFWMQAAERSWFNVSDNGTAIYAPGSPVRRRLVWVDRHGAVAEVPGEPDAINGVSLSRDGKKIVRPGRLSLWVEDIDAGTRTRVLSDLIVFSAGYLPDGRIVVSSNKDGDWDLYALNPNGGGALTPILQKPNVQHPMSVGTDGSIVFSETDPKTGVDLWLRTAEGQTRPLVTTPFNEGNANLSPDDTYIAYMSDESGRNEVYALPVSGKGDRVTVSTGGGSGPAWSRDGRELFYRAGDDLMSVEVKSMKPLTLGARKKLLDISAYEPGYFHDFDVSPDGQRFLLIRSEPDARPTKINVITNWFQELERLVKK